jgi:transcription initiation factor TFIID subunit TAF12
VTQLVLIDNVVTTGETLKSVCRLLHAHAPSLSIKEAIVMWTEGAGQSFDSIPVLDGRLLPIVSVGGHIPLLTTQQLHEYAAQQPQRQQQQQQQQQQQYAAEEEEAAAAAAAAAAEAE